MLTTFLDGSTRNCADLPSIVIGKGTYKPGWRWSVHVRGESDRKSERHIGYILEGQMVIKSVSGEEIVVGPGEAFEITPNHDAWVIGEVPCVALDFEPKNPTN
jgi:quercetin dioxygenase-like cupin family protein